MTTLSYAQETKAIKEHRCSFCNGIIRIGNTYMKSTHVHDGTIYDWKTHKRCADLADKMKMYDDADEGVTDEIFQETVSCKYFNLMLSLFNEDELKKFRDVIQHFRYVSFLHKLDYVIHHFAKLEKEKTNG